MTKTVNARQITTPGLRQQNSAQIVHEPEKYQRITGAEMCKISRLQPGHTTKTRTQEGKHTEIRVYSSQEDWEKEWKLHKNVINQSHNTRR